MNVFWRTTPLTEPEQALWRELDQAHSQSALRNNLSSSAVQLSAVGSGEYFKAIAAGLMTLGGLHGPVEQAATLLLQPVSEVTEFMSCSIAAGEKFPGWGNSFVKGQKDEHWLGVEKILAEHFPDRLKSLEMITEALHKRGKKIYPNPAAYTAVAGIIFGMPISIMGYLFLNSRLIAWTAIFQSNMKRL